MPRKTHYVKLQFDIHTPAAEMSRIQRRGVELGGQYDGNQFGGMSPCDGVEIFYEVKPALMAAFRKFIAAEKYVVFATAESETLKNTIPDCPHTRRRD